MIKSVIRILEIIKTFFERLIADEENSCRRCGVCHHVCQLMNQKNSIKVREK